MRARTARTVLYSVQWVRMAKREQGGEQAKAEGAGSGRGLWARLDLALERSGIHTVNRKLNMLDLPSVPSSSALDYSSNTLSSRG